jgi:hypothetical protein
MAIACFGAVRAAAQVSVTQRPPSTLAEARDWSAAIARRASELLSSPAMWDRSDTSFTCPWTAKTLSILCAFQRASAEAYRSVRDPDHSTANGKGIACSLQRDGSYEQGSCGAIFGKLPVLVLEKVPRITTGMWRTDAQPAEVWAGTMVDAQQPAMQAARQSVSAISSKKYSSRLIGFNNDSSVTFDDLQRLFRALQDRLARATPSAFKELGDSVEVEVYADNSGAIRTLDGWFPISGFSGGDSTLRFTVDTTAAIAPNALDREIVKRAARLLASAAVWNRKDDRECDAAATTWSIYCALEHASREVTGGFHHRRPALELVRAIVEERTRDRAYNHRLMDYNNDATTHLNDVRTLFAEALRRIQ